jgi:DNA-binding MarR family transcriptional regulator
MLYIRLVANFENQSKKESKKHKTHMQAILSNYCRRERTVMLSDNIQIFLEASNRLNSKTISLTRFQILALLSYFKDGIQYRELKAALGISDGKLISNLRSLKVMGYVDNFEVEIDHRRLDVYVLTEKGQDEIDKVASWMQLVKNITQSVGDENGKQS